MCETFDNTWTLPLFAHYLGLSLWDIIHITAWHTALLFDWNMNYLLRWATRPYVTCNQAIAEISIYWHDRLCVALWSLLYQLFSPNKSKTSLTVTHTCSLLAWYHCMYTQCQRLYCDKISQPNLMAQCSNKTVYTMFTVKLIFICITLYYINECIDL